MAIVRKSKVKPRIKKDLKGTRAKKKSSAAMRGKPKTDEKSLFVMRELAVEKAKFTHPQPVAGGGGMPQDLPRHYGVSRMVLLVRDPSWLHTWWEVGPGLIEQLKRRLGDEFYKAKRILRVYDVANIDFNGANAAGFFDIEINDHAEDWYINVEPAKSWCVDLGLKLTDGRFIMILRSNIVSTPLNGPSRITDEEWMVPEEMFARLYGMGLGAGRASPGKGWQARVGWASVSSRMGSGSMSSPVRVRR